MGREMEKENGKDYIKLEIGHELVCKFIWSGYNGLLNFDVWGGLIGWCDDDVSCYYNKSQG